MMLKKKLVGSTGSPLGRAGVRCEGGGGCRGVGGWRIGRSIFHRGAFDWPLLVL